MPGLLIRVLCCVLLLLFAYPLAMLLHPWWILVQPLGAFELFALMVDELTTIMRLPQNLSRSIQTGRWWWSV